MADRNFTPSHYSIVRLNVSIAFVVLLLLAVALIVWLP
jgi:hypothetical protein